MSSARSLVLTELEKQFANADTRAACLAVSRAKISQFFSASRLFDDTFPALLPPALIQTLTEELQVILSDPGRRDLIRSWLIKIVGIGCAEMLDNRGHVQPEIAKLLEWPEDLPQERVYAIVVAFVGLVTQQVLEALAKTLPQKIVTQADEDQCRQLEIFCLLVDKEKLALVKAVLFDQQRVFDVNAIAQLDATKAKVEGSLSERLVVLLKDRRTQSALIMVAAGFVAWGAMSLVNHFMQRPVEEKEEKKGADEKKVVKSGFYPPSP